MSFDFRKVFDGTYYQEISNPNEKDFLPYGEGLDEETQVKIDALITNLTTDSARLVTTSAPSSLLYGRVLSVIHPFSAWEFILSDPSRKERLKKLFIEYQKDHSEKEISSFDLIISAFKLNEHILRCSRNQTIQGFPINFRRRHQLGQLMQHLDSFCERLDLNQKQIEELIVKDKFEELVECIIFH